MKVSLNLNKSSFCSIGSLLFTLEDEEPKEVDPTRLSKLELVQLEYNIRRGVLIADSIEELVKLPQIKVPVDLPKPTSVEIKEGASLDKILGQEISGLNELLVSSVATIKRKSKEMTPRLLRKLVELEKSQKNRQSLLQFLNESLEKNTKSENSVVGDKDIGSGDKTYTKATLIQGTKGLVNLDNISEVVESNLETMTFSQDKVSKDG